MYHHIPCTIYHAGTMTRSPPTCTMYHVPVPCTMQVPWRGARQPAEHDVADSHHLPQRRLRGHRAQHLLRPGHRRHHRHDGQYLHTIYALSTLSIHYLQRKHYGTCTVVVNKERNKRKVLGSQTPNTLICNYTFLYAKRSKYLMKILHEPKLRFGPEHGNERRVKFNRR